MGLDQYAYRVNKNEHNNDFSYESFDEYGDETSKLIAQWRKHPNLEGWMEKLFNDKANVQGFVGNTVFNDTSVARVIGQINEPNEEMLGKALNDKEAAKEIRLQEAIADVANAHKSRVFNRQPIRLTISDLDQLEMHVKNNNLPDTQGFFFGDDSDDYYKELDLEFINNARQAIRDGYDVYYESWW